MKAYWRKLKLSYMLWYYKWEIESWLLKQKYDLFLYEIDRRKNKST
jgi:hypothetical protein